MGCLIARVGLERVLLDHGDANLELVVHDDQGVVQTIAHIDRLNRRKIHVGIGLECFDELYDTAGPETDFADKAVDLVLDADPINQNSKLRRVKVLGLKIKPFHLDFPCFQ